ncbi:hypothetical protein [Nocardioides pantholopis]|uniref:hypothetical protein n=1 Tax=Nocardioides pantholopis TaxID=2483798 RepID=UPI000F0735B6|nr:hypothetical protein [Nocardioides pantholopis]
MTRGLHLAPHRAPDPGPGQVGAGLPAPLAGVLGDLRLDPATATWSRRPGRGDAWLVLPSAARPRLLVPAGPGGARLTAQRLARGPRARVTRAAATAVVRRGAALPLPRLRVADPGLAELRRWLAPAGADPERCVLGVLLGPPRANRKPVLVLLDGTGQPLCYAKAGVGALSTGLVRAETRALASVAAMGLRSLRVPRVLRTGRWRGLELLATSPLAGRGSLRHPADLPVRATRELMAHGVRRDRPLGASAILAPDRIAAPPVPGLPALAGLRERLLAVAGDRRLPLGAAHGDWTPWNLARSGDLVEAWDWERFETDVPQGLDAVHFAASAVDHDAPARAEERLLRDLPGQLAACGVDPALARTLLCTYLLHICGRYVRDLALEPTASVERRTRWAARLLTDQVGLLEHEESP